jgi:putative copper export protein
VLALYSLSVLIHLVAAAAWVGAMIFFAAVVIPVVRRPEFAGVYGDLVRSVGRRFRWLGWIALGTLVATGISNLWLRGVGVEQLTSMPFWRSDFGRALHYKLVFVVLVLACTAAHDALALRSRRASALLGRATLLLSVGVLACAVWLVRGFPW